jgi:hypothetical protein
MAIESLVRKKYFLTSEKNVIFCYNFQHFWLVGTPLSDYNFFQSCGNDLTLLDNISANQNSNPTSKRNN